MQYTCKEQKPMSSQGPCWCSMSRRTKTVTGTHSISQLRFRDSSLQSWMWIYTWTKGAGLGSVKTEGERRNFKPTHVVLKLHDFFLRCYIARNSLAVWLCPQQNDISILRHIIAEKENDELICMTAGFIKLAILNSDVAWEKWGSLAFRADDDTLGKLVLFTSVQRLIKTMLLMRSENITSKSN